jgi:hypothetical protein
MLTALNMGFQMHALVIHWEFPLVHFFLLDSFTYYMNLLKILRDDVQSLISHTQRPILCLGPLLWSIK